jgi:hypothetical protein
VLRSVEAEPLHAVGAALRALCADDTERAERCTDERDRPLSAAARLNEVRWIFATCGAAAFSTAIPAGKRLAHAATELLDRYCDSTLGAPLHPVYARAVSAACITVVAKFDHGHGVRVPPPLRFGAYLKRQLPKLVVSVEELDVAGAVSKRVRNDTNGAPLLPTPVAPPLPVLPPLVPVAGADDAPSSRSFILSDAVRACNGAFSLDELRDAELDVLFATGFHARTLTVADYIDVYAPVARPLTVRTVWAPRAAYALPPHIVDFAHALAERLACASPLPPARLADVRRRPQAYAAACIVAACQRHQSPVPGRDELLADAGVADVDALEALLS